MLNVHIDTISFVGDNKKRLLFNDIQFSLERNKIFSIVGKNGEGKSTLIKALTRLLNESQFIIKGKVEYENKDLLSIPYNELLMIRRDKIKYVFQDAVTSFDHLRKFKYYFDLMVKNPSEVDELLNYFILPDSRKIYSLYPYEVSIGMAQRSSLILALLAHPEIIILDEPTSAVDVGIANLFMLKLKEYVSAENNCVLLITQDLAAAQKISHKIAFLSGGKLSEFYSPDKFFTESEDQALTNFLNAHNSI